MTQRRIFAFLWPDAPAPAVDADAHQHRYVRICPRGPLRIAFLLALTAVTFSTAFLGTLVLATRPTVVGAVLTVTIVATLLVVTLRAWQLGTYVNDEGVRVIRSRQTTTLTWDAVRSIRDEGSAVVIDANQVVPTHIHRRGLDHLTSVESFEMARDRLGNWWHRR